MNLAAISYHMATDPEFLSQLKTNPIQALEQKGMPTTAEELFALKSILTKKNLPKLASGDDLSEQIEPWYPG